MSHSLCRYVFSLLFDGVFVRWSFLALCVRSFVCSSVISLVSALFCPFVRCVVIYVCIYNDWVFVRSVVLSDRQGCETIDRTTSHGAAMPARARTLVGQAVVCVASSSKPQEDCHINKLSGCWNP